jgi:MarR family 2-MHQ and catechol resistance regulon transcriptional repressor
VSTETALPILTPQAADPGLERLGLERDTEALYDALSELVRVYQFRDRDRICCYDVSVTQCYALEALVRRGGTTLNDLAAQLYLDKSTASRVVDALERKGYMTRLPHPEDRRAVLLEATAAGRALEGKIRDSILAEERELLAGFAPDVRQAMTQLLRQLARATATRGGGEGASCCQIP